MLVRVLGPVHVEVDGRRVALGGARALGVLAVLVAAGGRPVSAARLADELYGPSEAGDPTAVVRVHVSNVRGALAAAGAERSVLSTVPGGYALRVPPVVLDAATFDDRCRRARGCADPEEALALVDEALALWRGDPFGELAALPSVRPEAVRLQVAERAARARRAELLMAIDRVAVALGELESMVARHPLDETFRRLLMVALYRSGRATDALRCADDLRAVLRRDHGAEPGPSIAAVERAILAHDPALGGVVGPPSADPAADSTAGSAWSLLPEGARPWVAAVVVCRAPVTVAEAAALAAGDAAATGAPRPLAGDVAGEGAWALRRGVELGLLVEDDDVDPPCYRPYDEPTRAAVTELVDVFTLARLHARRARALAGAGAADDPARVGPLAVHADLGMASGLIDEDVVGWLHRAGDQAAAAGDLQGSRRWFTRALQAADELAPEDGRQRAELQVALAEVAWRSGEGTVGRHELSALVEVARRLGDPQLVARAAVAASGGPCPDRLPFANRGVERAADTLAAALSCLPPDDGRGRARVLAHLGSVQAALGRFAEAAQAGAEAGRLAERSADPRLLAEVLACRAAALCLPGDHAERQAVVRRLGDVAGPIGDPALSQVVTRQRLLALLRSDEVDAARDLVATLLSGARRLASPLEQQRTELVQAMVHLLDGEWHAAATLARQALDTGDRVGDGHFAFRAHLLQMTVVHYNRRDVGELRAIAATLGAEPADEGSPGRGTWRPAATLIGSWHDDPDRVRRSLRALVADRCRAVPRDQVWFCNLAALADVADLLHERPAAEELYDLLLPFSELRATVDGIIAMAPVSYYLGLLARVLGRQSLAESWLRATAERAMAWRRPAHPWPWAMAGLAAVLQARPGDDARTEGRALALRAQTAARSVGSRAVLRWTPRPDGPSVGDDASPASP